MKDAPEEYGFTREELNKPLPLRSRDPLFAEKENWTPLEVATKLEAVYTGPIAFEYMHI